MYKTLIIASLIVFVLSTATGGTEQRARILKSDETGVIIEYIPGSKKLRAITEGNATFTKVRIPETIALPGLEPGEPELYAYPLPVQLPGLTGNTVEVVSSEFDDRSSIVLQPVPSFKRDGVDMTPVFKRNSEAYSVGSLLPETICRLVNVGESRGNILGTVLISPLQYNPATQTLRIYSKIVIRLRYGIADRQERIPDAMAKGISVNETDFASSRQNLAKRTAESVAMPHSVLASGVWYKFSIGEEGMYKITGSALLAAGIPASTNPMNIKMFNNGGIELPDSVNSPYLDDLKEITIYTVDAGSNATLDAEDYIIFYGKSVRGWNYSRSTKSFSHYINHFTETNIYWLNLGASSSKQMSVLPLSDNLPAFKPQTVKAKLFRDDDKINVTNSGLEWLGQQFNNGESYTYATPLPGLDIAQPITYRFTFGAQAMTTSYFNIYEHSDIIRTTPTMRATYIDDYDYYFIPTNPAIQTVTRLPSFTDGQSLLRFSFTSGDANGYGFFNWLELFYSQYPKAQDDRFAFHAHDTTAITQYKIAGFSANQVYLFDVSRFDSVLIHTSTTMKVDTSIFTLQLDSGSARSLYLIGKNSFRAVNQFTQVENQDLHGDSSMAEEIIVTHSDFMPAALRLKQHRERGGTDYVKTSIVTIDKIYNEFGGGLPSPRAIRNYLKYLYTRWSTPAKYLLLLGDGDFDYRGILTERSNKVPVWETGIEFHPIRSYTTDDDFVIFSNTPRVAMGVGRIPARSLTEANAAVDKIVEYEANPIYDPWRLRVTLVADDAWTGSYSDGLEHSRDLENLSTTVPPLFQAKKIFLYEYPVVYTTNGRRKPSVNEAIRNEINQGTLLLNFAGHGNPRLWTHEQVFVRETDFPLLTNKGKYFFLVAATCNYSAMDMLNDQSSGELLTLLPHAGAIATYCATRPVYSIWNADLNRALYQKMFTTNSSGYVVPTRLGDIVYKTRQNLFNDNDRKYVLLGDPALRIAFPGLVCNVDSINGVPGNQTAQLQALSNSTLAVSIRDTSNTPIHSYSGTAEVIVYDGDKTVMLADPEDRDTLTYKTDGNIIFRGQARIDSGALTTRFIVPKDIAYSNDDGRVTVYYSNSTVDGAGYTTKIRINGTDTAAIEDTDGPAIRLFLERRTFRSGDVVGNSPLLLADLEDEHGLNTSGAGVGHRMEAWLDDHPQSIDVTAYYKSKLNTYQEGTIEYRFNGLTPGSHKLKVRAWDTYNNSSQSETVFDVANSVGMQLTGLYNFPNPFSNSTIFSIEHNQIGSMDAEIKIYTVAGRLIQSLETRNVTEQVITIPWDGRDRDGDDIANGIYLYKAIVRTSDRRLSGEAFGKLSVLK